MDDNLAISASQWLASKDYDVVAVNDQMVSCNTEAWARTGALIGKHFIKWSVMPHSPAKMATLGKAIFDKGNLVHTKSNRLEEALGPYLRTGIVTGLKFGRLSQGNTRVVVFVDANDLSTDDVRALVRYWLSHSGSLRRIGRSPGQNLGEVYWGIFTLGLGGFRVNQPAEIYPVFVYGSEAKFEAACRDLLEDSVCEAVQDRSSMKNIVLPEAPVYCQAIFVCTANAHVEYLRSGRETRSAWRHYKKPKLAQRILQRKDMPSF